MNPTLDPGDNTENRRQVKVQRSHSGTRIAAIIPARYGSSRFDGKPLANIAGKPMIQRVYEAAALSEIITDVAVATDDTRIADAVRGFGGYVLMTDTAHRSGTDRVDEAAELLGLAERDIAVNVQGDQPLLNPRCLEQVVTPLAAEPETGMSTLAFAIVDPSEITNPKDVKVVFADDGAALYFSRSPIPCPRDADTAFPTYKHLGIYAYTRGFLRIFKALPTGRLESVEKLEQLRALEHGYRIHVVVTEHDSPEVDLPADIARIEGMLSRG